jgi:hypothetical protein
VGQLRLAQVLLSANALALSTATAFLIPRLDLGSGARVLRASRLLGAGLLGLGLVVTGLVALDPLDVLRHLHTSATASLVATTAVLAASAALSGMSATRMVRIRRTVPARQWLPWRALAAYSEPAVGLSLSPAMGSVGAALGQLVNQLLLLVLVSRAPSADAPGGGAGAQGKPDPVGEALDHARH